MKHYPVQPEVWELIQDRNIRVAESTSGVRPFQVVGKASTMLAITRDLGSNRHVEARRTFARALSERYYGVTPHGDHQTPVAVEVSPATYRAVIETADRLGLVVEHAGFDPAVEIPRVKRAGYVSRKTPGVCGCGCGGETSGGKFQPGHDMRLKSRLLRRVDEMVDEDAGTELVERGWFTAPAMEERIERARVRLQARPVL